jgi:predicted  nucleic acid-binding Zn-ribbon protein
MKAILYVAPILVLGVAVYFTLEHQRKFDEVETVRLKTIADNKAVSANADAKESEFRKLREDLAAAEQKRDESTAALQSMNSDGVRIEREVADLDSTIKSQEEEIADLNKNLEEISNLVKDLVQDVSFENIAEKVQEIKEDRKARQEKLEELETLIAAAEKSLTAKRSDIDNLTRREVQRTARIGRNSMEAVVTAVNQDWGFLVIGAGTNSGFTPQTSLLVKRDGRLVGRVNPSAIEPTQTIAEIDFKSLPVGARIQPGDRVVLAKPNTN